jgi:hypothetical protein
MPPQKGKRMRFVELNTTRQMVIFLAEQGVRDARIVIDAERKRVTVLCHEIDIQYARKMQTHAILPGNPSIRIRRFRFWEKKPYKIEVKLL